MANTPIVPKGKFEKKSINYAVLFTVITTAIEHGPNYLAVFVSITVNQLLALKTHSVVFAERDHFQQPTSYIQRDFILKLSVAVVNSS